MGFIRAIKTIFIVIPVSLSLMHTRLTPHASLAVFGSQGRTGIHVVNRALSDNKKVVSLVKPRHDICSTENHIVYKGDVTNLDDVDCLYRNNKITGTIICLGGDTREVGSDMLTKGTTNIIKAINRNNASPKIAVITSIGTGDTANDLPFFFKILMKTILKDAFIDKNNQESLFLQKGNIGNNLEYTVVRPSGLTDDHNKLEKISVIDAGNGVISRKNVANFCYDAIYDKLFKYNKKAVSITGKRE